MRVLDIFSLKPLDTAGLIENIGSCNGKVVVAE